MEAYRSAGTACLGRTGTATGFCRLAACGRGCALPVIRNYSTGAEGDVPDTIHVFCAADGAVLLGVVAHRTFDAEFFSAIGATVIVYGHAIAPNVWE